jgi:2-dehydropantoate 2-reductase
MRIAVFGTGGVGGYFGGRLAQAGEEVVFIARGEHLRAIRGTGLQVDSLKGDFTIQPMQATDEPRQVGEVDAVLVGVKTWQVPEAAAAMQPMVGSQTFVVPLENGVDAPEQLAAVLGREHVLGGLCQISCLLAGPGHVRHVGLDPYIAFGEMDGQPSERAIRLQQAFERAVGVRAEVSADIQAAMWRKFLFIAAISGVGAATRAPIGVTRSVPETRTLLVQAMREVHTLAQRRGVHLPEEVVDQTLSFIDGLAPVVMASMQRDIIEGRPSELAAQNGAVVRMGLEAGIPTPVHTFLYSALLPQELKAREQVSF